MWPNPEFPADVVTFTEEILNGKLYFCCSVGYLQAHWGSKFKETNKPIISLALENSKCTNKKD